MTNDSFLIWENDEFTIKTPLNPHQPYIEGLHIIVSPKRAVEAAWDDPALTGQAFELSAKVCGVIKDLEMGPWFNLQANGNWGLLPNSTPFFHVHIYGRNKTENWGKALELPITPGTYQNEPMPEHSRTRLGEALKATL